MGHRLFRSPPCVIIHIYVVRSMGFMALMIITMMGQFLIGDD